MIYEFDPVIYPTRLWVAVAPSFKEVDDTFYLLDDEGNVVADAYREYKRQNTSKGTTFIVANKENKWMGCFVVIWKRKYFGCGLCTHETMHVVDWIDEELDLGGHTFCDGEPRAYLGQWISECIEKVVRNKV